jgi:hypothetical protein
MPERRRIDSFRLALPEVQLRSSGGWELENGAVKTAIAASVAASLTGEVGGDAGRGVLRTVGSAAWGFTGCRAI